MYSTLALVPNSKRKGKITGTHQKIDRSARWLLNKKMPIAQRKFPSYDEIVYFEGYRGPDGLKRKSPGVDEPSHFIQPDNDDGILIGYIDDHFYNAPSWEGSLAVRQVWARLAQGRAASRQQLCQIGPLSRAGALPSWRRTRLQPSRA